MINQDTVFKRFNEIKYLIKCDTHIHTDFSHGKLSVENALNRAKILGLNLVAFTDHYEYPFSLDQYIDKINFYKNKFNFKVLTGIEVNVELPYTVKRLSQFEVVIGSFHSYPISGKDNFKIEYDCNMSIIENPLFHILGHAGGQSLKFLGDFPVKYFANLIKKCVMHYKIFELNYSRHYKIKHT